MKKDVIVLKEFVKRYPNNDISIHLMDDLHYGGDPINYYAIYKTLPTALKNTERGKYIGNELGHLVNLVRGATAPTIYGNTPDGKPFDLKTIDKKFILLDFWHADNELGRDNHKKLMAVLRTVKDPKKFGIISVFLDSKSDLWLEAIKDDQMNWVQVSDLKGDSSPNATNWMVGAYPTYYLVDSHWHIVKSDILNDDVDVEVSDFLQKHP